MKVNVRVFDSDMFERTIDFISCIRCNRIINSGVAFIDKSQEGERHICSKCAACDPSGAEMVVKAEKMVAGATFVRHNIGSIADLLKKAQQPFDKARASITEIEKKLVALMEKEESISDEENMLNIEYPRLQLMHDIASGFKYFNFHTDGDQIDFVSGPGVAKCPACASDVKTFAVGDIHYRVCNTMLEDTQKHQTIVDMIENAKFVPLEPRYILQLIELNKSKTRDMVRAREENIANILHGKSLLAQARTEMAKHSELVSKLKLISVIGCECH